MYSHTQAQVPHLELKRRLRNLVQLYRKSLLCEVYEEATESTENEAYCAHGTSSTEHLCNSK
jgi:hypothetical protein